MCLLVAAGLDLGRFGRIERRYRVFGLLKIRHQVVTLIMLNENPICFIFVGRSNFAVVVEMISSPEKNLRRNSHRLPETLSIRPWSNTSGWRSGLRMFGFTLVVRQPGF